LNIAQPLLSLFPSDNSRGYEGSYDRRRHHKLP
jgi:hypothetical protein